MPFGEYVPLRGLLEALGAPVDQVPTRRRRRHRAAGRTRRAARRRRVDAWRWSSRGRCSSAAGRATGCSDGGGGHPQPDERRQLHRHDPADPAGRVEPAARDRDRPVARAGVADRVLRVRHARRRRDRPHGGQRAGGDPSHGVELRTGRTWYVRLGDRPFIVVLIVAFAVPSCGTAGHARSPAQPHRQRSMSTVTGPSLTSDDLHLGAEAAGGDGRAELAQRGRRRPRRAARRARVGRPRSSSGGDLRTCRRRA